tara:strand:+ start:1346 stop:1564 length:219 start_codon:yes stop_codon:yes gene_type:complete
MEKLKNSPVLLAYVGGLHSLSLKGLSRTDRSAIRNECHTMAERLTDAEIKAAKLAAELMAEFIAYQSKKLSN